MKIRSCALCCALALAAGPAASASEPAQVVVTGARYDQRRDDTASTIVVGREELLQHGDRTLADALARLPGITVRAGDAGTSAIRMRGLGNGYTQVLLNGVAAPAGFALESLAPELIERIDIVRTASAELGMQSIAGTVNIILRKSVAQARRSFKLGVDAQRGDWSPSVSGEVADKGARHSYTVSGTLSRTRLLSSKTDLETRSGELERTTARHELNTTDVASIAPRMNWTLEGGSKLSVHGLLSANRRRADGENHEGPGAVAPSAIPHSAFNFLPRSAFLQWGLGWERPLAAGAKLQFEAGANDSHRRSEFEFAGLPRNAGDARRVSVRIREEGAQASAKYALPLAGGHQLLLGWDAARTKRRQSRAGNDGGNLAETEIVHYRGLIERAAVFIQDDWQVDQAWSLSLGLRAEGLDTTASDTAGAPVLLKTRLLSPVLQVLYKPGKATQLRAGLTRTYKAPAMFALIPRRYVVDNNNNETNPDTMGNPALRPELAWGLDAGFDHYFGKDAMLGLSAFVRRIDDVTVDRLYQDRQGWIVVQENGGRALAGGVLLEGKLPLKMLWAGAPAIDTRFSLARNHSRLAGGQAHRSRLDGQEPSSATLGLDYRAPDTGLTLGASLSYKEGGEVAWSDRVSSATGSVRALDVFGVFKIGANTRLRLGAVNLLRRDDTTQMRSGERRTAVLARETIGLRLALEGDLGR